MRVIQARRLLLAVSVASLALLAPPAAHEQAAAASSEVRLTAVADAWLNKAKPKKNYGSATVLRAQKGAALSVLRFRLTPWLGVEAKRLTLVLGGVAGNASRLAVHRTTGGWKEGSVTWATRPLPVQAAGAASVAGSEVRINLKPLFPKGVIDREVLHLRVSDTSGALVRFGSRESATKPRLVLAAGACPERIHASYTAVGPDGKRYARWHPQRDPKTGCYFGHEHGSDPARFAAATKYKPTFGYVGTLGGFSEPHTGFKNFLLDDGKGHHWLWTVHIGTAGAARVCTRFHSVDLAIARISTGALLARVHFMGDFGRAEHNETLLPLTPDACPNQYQAAKNAGSTGARQFSINSIGPESPQYEPWRLDHSRTIFGLSGDIAFNTRSSMTTCDSLKCNKALPTNHAAAGALRLVQAGHIKLVAGTNSGHFTTNPYGRKRGGSVQQYIKASINVVSQPPQTAVNYWPKSGVNSIFVLMHNADFKGVAREFNVDGQLRMPN